MSFAEKKSSLPSIFRLPEISLVVGPEMTQENFPPSLVKVKIVEVSSHLYTISTFAPFTSASVRVTPSPFSFSRLVISTLETFIFTPVILYFGSPGITSMVLVLMSMMAVSTRPEVVFSLTVKLITLLALSCTIVKSHSFSVMVGSSPRVSALSKSSNS